MKFGVVRFPGSCDDVDALAAARRVGDAVPLWHADRDLQGVDGVIVPGGFSYGDYLRAGAIARFAPVMEEVAEFAREGGLVLGICNGFQVLCEAGLLPGALLPNASLKFVFRQVELEVVDPDTPFTRACREGGCPMPERGRENEHSDRFLDHAPPLGPSNEGLRVLGQPRARLSIPVKHTTGRYFAPGPVDVVLRYAPGQNPNGSQDDIAGVRNEAGNVLGLMPHPEHAVGAPAGSSDGLKAASAALAGSSDGLRIFESMRAHVTDRVAA
jgi:phosphoribosylformylglycinamidine synthase